MTKCLSPVRDSSNDERGSAVDLPSAGAGSNDLDVALLESPIL